MSITLEQLQQATARRVGPYRQVYNDTQTPATATFDSAFCPQLRSNIEVDLVTNLYLLRRGDVLNGGEINVDSTDRVRLVSNYEAELGRVDVDRSWGTAPIPGEMFEFHHLDPDVELAEAVMAGLRRCFLPDTVQAQPTAPFGGIDLTAQFAWLTEPWQIGRVRYGWLSPYQDAPWDTYTTMGHLILSGTHGMALPMAVWVDAWRPSWSWVNGAESTGGPTADLDTLDVDLDYATAAAHIEAWHHFPSRMVAASAGGYQATQAMAAQEFSRQAALYGPGRPTDVGFQTVVRVGVAGRGWINNPW